MLLSLHVKNLALIEEEEVSFTDGLNIMTGETGAGKSIIIGSVNLALGAKADRSIIRTGAPYALIEMTFQLDNSRQWREIEKMDLPVDEDGILLIKRKILPTRSVCSVSGETVTLRQLREISALLIDIYGQRENQKLLRRDAQLQTIDDFAGDAALHLKQKVAAGYKKWHAMSDEWENHGLDAAARKREVDLLTFETDEITDAAIQPGEDEELEKKYRLMGSFRKISEAAGAAAALTDGDEAGASSLIGRACRELGTVSGIDEGLDDLSNQLEEIDSLLSDFNRSLNDYVGNLTFDAGEYERVQERLNEINHLKDKYGPSLEDIEASLKKRQERLDFLTDYEASRKKLRADMEAEKKNLLSLCSELSVLRRKTAGEFASKMKEALMELNFLQVEFSMEIETGEEYLGANGYDRCEFFISMNPGEAPRPLEKIASGGELSRIMLALKTVFAGRDDIHTFIFDEIDTGISGQTAWKVSEKMGRLAQDHQILCITHLPQIAAMEDSHYLIAKDSEDGRTMTHITQLSEDESDREIARMMGGAEISGAALENARDMKRMAHKSKSERDK